MKSSAKRIVKSISFSAVDPYEMRLLRHSEQYVNFSRYLKRLIQNDMEGGTAARKG